MSITSSIFSKVRVINESVELDSIEEQDNGTGAVTDSVVEEFTELSQVIADEDPDDIVTEAVAIMDACYNAMNMLMEAYGNLEHTMTTVLVESADIDDAQDTIIVMTEAALGDIFASLIARLKTIIQNMSIFVTNAFIKTDATVREKEFMLWYKKVGDPKSILDANKFGSQYIDIHEWDIHHPLMTTDVASKFNEVMNSKSGIPNTTDFDEMDRIINNRNSGGGEWSATDITLLLMKEAFNKEIKDYVKSGSVISTMDDHVKGKKIVLSNYTNIDSFLDNGYKVGSTQSKVIGDYHNELKAFIGNVNKMIVSYESENRKAMRDSENITSEQKSLMHTYHSKRIMFLSQASSLATVIYMKRISLIRQCINEYRAFVNKFATNV